MEKDKDYIEIEIPLKGKRTRELQTNSVLVGRSPTCDVWLMDASVSRHHARLEQDPKGFWRLWDLHSSHGSVVNGEKTEMAVLDDGDRIVLGNCRLTFHSAEKPTAESANPYTVVAEDTIAVEVDGNAIAEEVPPTVEVLNNLHDGLRRVTRARSTQRLHELLAEEFRRTLHPQRIAIGIEKDNTCTWPYVCDGDGNETDADDLEQRLKSPLERLEGTRMIQWVTVRKGTERIASAPTKRLVFLFPVKSAGRRMAHVYVEFPDSDHAPPQESVETLALLVRDAALLWENLELQEREKEFEEELRQARAIQVDLFPNRYDLDERVEIAAENIPCKWVSGDYYDFQKLHAGRLTFTIADVMSHGLPAALLMANIQSVFRTGVRFGWPLEEIDRAINQMVMANTASNVFVTGLLGVCDLDASELSLISAGHRWPSLMLGGEQAALDESQHRFAWGMVDERTGPVVRFGLPEGDWSFVAYTDGLENPTPSLERGFPLDTIPRLQRDLSQSIASELCETIIKAVFAFADKASVLADDITLLVLRGVGKG